MWILSSGQSAIDRLFKIQSSSYSQSSQLQIQACKHKIQNRRHTGNFRMATDFRYNRMQTDGSTDPNQTLGQQQTVLVAPRSELYEKTYNAKLALVFGIVQITCGLICMVSNIVNIVLHSSISATLPFGIICGVMFILAGSFQIVSSKRRTKCWIITSLVFSILAACFTIPIFVGSSLGICIERYGEHYMIKDPMAIVAFNGVMLFAALIEGIVAIVTSAFACRPLCGTRPRGMLVAHQVQYIENPNQPGEHIVMLIPVQSGMSTALPTQQGLIQSVPPGDFTQTSVVGPSPSNGLPLQFPEKQPL